MGFVVTLQNGGDKARCIATTGLESEKIFTIRLHMSLSVGLHLQHMKGHKEDAKFAWALTWI